MRSLAFAVFVWILISAANTEAAPLSPSRSYYPPDFITRLEQGLSDSELKAALFELLSSGHVHGTGQDSLVPTCDGVPNCRQHRSLGYTQARKILFGALHLRQTSGGYGVFDVYCENLTTERDYRRQPPGPGQIPDPAVLNAEHTWPQSHFSGKFNRDLQKSDLHILFPVLATANSSRSNLDFADVVTPTNSPCSKSRRGYSAEGTSQEFFEPPPAHKGNVARAIFYFSIRYKLRVPHAEETSLKAWNRQDPPDEAEHLRNDAIEEAQGVRNPFIDHPELADRIADF